MQVSIKERSLELDILRSFLNVLIVFYHCAIAHIILNDLHYTPWDRWLVDFLCNQVAWNVMPVFFFISGYLMLRGYSKESYKGKVMRRLRRLFVPYILWNLIFLLVFAGRVCLGQEQTTHSAGVYLLKIFGLFTQPFDTPLWYIRLLLAYLLLLPLIARVVRTRLGVVILSVLVFMGMVVMGQFSFRLQMRIMWPLYSIPAFCFGGYLAQSGISFADHARRWRRLYLIVGIVGFCLQGVPTLLEEPVFLMRGMGIVGLFFSFSRERLESVGSSGWVKWLSAFSFFLYAAHRPICWYVTPFWEKVIGLQWFWSFSGAATMLMIVDGVCIVLICALLYAGLNRIAPRFCDILSGRY